MKTTKLIIVAGARPNFMKVKPVLKAIDSFNRLRGPHELEIQTLLVHTGQHYDENMSAVFFRELGIRPPDINLGVGSGSHAEQTANIMVRFDAICDRESPDWVIVVGDVNSTMACTLVCAKKGIRVAHVEAGLRSFDRTMPEEVNRVVTDALADLLFTPAEDAGQNLIHEGICAEKIKFVGNIMIDSLVESLPKSRFDDVLGRLGLDPGKFVYVTLHRPSNVDVRRDLSMIMTYMDQVSRRLQVVFPIHPRTRKMLIEFGIMPSGPTKVLLLEPLGYLASLRLTENARFVLTDSGGLQEETTFFRVPCLTLRPNTERPITVTLGSNKLTRLDRLMDDVDEVLNGPEHIGQVPPLWDGHTAERILRHILEISSPLQINV